MRKSLICILAAAAFTATAPAVSAAANISYNYESNAVTVDTEEQVGKQNVFIINEIREVVYIDENNSGFAAGTKFCLKRNPREGVYTIKFRGNDNGISSIKFRIGINQDVGDIKMVKRTNPGDNTDSFVRYACSISEAKEFKTVIIKMGGEYYGFQLPQVWSVSGGESSTSFGVQIEGADIKKITDVWLSERMLDSNGILTKGQAQSGQSEEGAGE